MSVEVGFEAVPPQAPARATVLFESSLEWLLENGERVAVKVVDDRYAMVLDGGRASAQGPLCTIEAGAHGYAIASDHIAGRRFRPALAPFPLNAELADL